MAEGRSFLSRLHLGRRRRRRRDGEGEREAEGVGVRAMAPQSFGASLCSYITGGRRRCLLLFPGVSRRRRRQCCFAAARDLPGRLRSANHRKASPRPSAASPLPDVWKPSFPPHLDALSFFSSFLRRPAACSGFYLLKVPHHFDNFGETERVKPHSG